MRVILPPIFFRDLPAFMNFNFDSARNMVIWLVGTPELMQTLRSPAYQALMSRVQVHCHINPITDPNDFNDLVQQSFKAAGCTRTLLSEEGLEMLRIASRGRYRQAGQLIKTAMFLSSKKGLDYLSDESIKFAAAEAKPQ